jgi:hypothetical protein
VQFEIGARLEAAQHLDSVPDESSMQAGGLDGADAAEPRLDLAGNRRLGEQDDRGAHRSVVD